MAITQKEEYQHQDRMFIKNGQLNVCEAKDFLVVVFFWYQNSTFQEIEFLH